MILPIKTAFPDWGGIWKTAYIYVYSLLKMIEVLSQRCVKTPSGGLFLFKFVIKRKRDRSVVINRSWVDLCFWFILDEDSCWLGKEILSEEWWSWEKCSWSSDATSSHHNGHTLLCIVLKWQWIALYYSWIQWGDSTTGPAAVWHESTEKI